MKTKLLIIIAVISSAIILGIMQLDQDLETGNYQYEIQGNIDGTGIGKTDLIFTRVNIDEPSNIHTVDLTKDLHYTDIISFLDWNIHSFDNYVFVSWITNEQSWSDVFLAISDDYGKTFDVKNISQSKEYVHQYKIDYSEDTIYFVWQHEFITEENDHINQITFTKSDNFGVSFGQQKLLSTFDKSSYEFDLEAFDDNVFVAWRHDIDSLGEKNIWFATSTNRGEYFEREAKLFGARVDAESFNDILHLTWVSVENDDQVWYAYSEDLGKTLHSRIIFDADWKLSPYAERPIPVITINDEIFIEWEMNNKEGEKTPYQVRIGSDSEKTVSGSYELEEPLCIGGRGMIVNENCEIIGKYDVSTGMPIVENKEQCDMLEGDWNEKQNNCDSKYGGK